MAVFTREVVGEGPGMWQKRFSAFCFPLEGGVCFKTQPGASDSLALLSYTNTHC